MPKNTAKGNITASLVKRANDGDDSAMSALIEKITPAAKAKALRFARGRSRISDEDLVQEGMIGFLNAVRTFDPSKNVPFEAYAGMCIESRIKNSLAKQSNAGNSAVTTADALENLTGSSVPAAADPFVVWEESSEIETFRSTYLSVFESKVFSLRYDGMKNTEISRTLGCTAKAVDNAVQRIRSKYLRFKSRQ